MPVLLIKQLTLSYFFCLYKLYVLFLYWWFQDWNPIYTWVMRMSYNGPVF